MDEMNSYPLSRDHPTTTAVTQAAKDFATSHDFKITIQDHQYVWWAAITWKDQRHHRIELWLTSESQANITYSRPTAAQRLTRTLNIFFRPLPLASLADQAVNLDRPYEDTLEALNRCLASESSAA
jgi:hypothetical protein